MSKIAICNGQIVTMNSRNQVLNGDLLIVNERIKSIGKLNKKDLSGAQTIDARGMIVIPGLIQGHTHLCQTLFRGDADDLALLDWLKKKIWPMEAAHTAKSLYASAQVGLLEMQKSGTTAILDMGTVHHTDALLEAAAESGIRYWGGKCLMDIKAHSGPLYQNTKASIEETLDLITRWDGRAQRVTYALCPRFAVSCTDSIMEMMADLQKTKGLIIHTHASESLEEIALLKKRTKMGNIDYFAKLGLLNRKTVIAHGVHLEKGELQKMVKAKTSITHCPSSNLKLGSGIAPIELYRKAKLNVCLGADGAPCNNSMDPFIEMRLAALLQKPRFGTRALPARHAFEMATIAGAKALGVEKDIGSLEVGKLADIVLLRRDHASVATVEDPFSALVYSCLGRDVDSVMIGGEWVVRHGNHLRFNEADVLQNAKKEHLALLKRL